MPNPITIHSEGKIDIHRRKTIYEQTLRQLELDAEIIPENKAHILEFLKDCEIGKTVIGKAKKKIGCARCLKYLGILRQLSLIFGKPFDQVSQGDMERFVYSLEHDQILSRANKPYSIATKADIKKTVKKFWKWKDGNNRVYPGLVEWIDTCEGIKEVPALNRAEVEQMIECTANPRDRALVMVLFDSGARVEELLNVRLRKEHLFWKEEIGSYMIRLEYSKTKPRTISLPMSTECIRKWLAVHPAKDNSQAQLFPMAYPALKMVISRLGKKALGKRVTPHMLRHSSATFYANRLKNPYKLCYRYGWAMSSDMVNRYLDREGIIEEETASIVKKEEYSATAIDNRILREELSLLQESLAEMGSRYVELRQQLDRLCSGNGVLGILATISKEQEKGAGFAKGSPWKGFGIALPD